MLLKLFSSLSLSLTIRFDASQIVFISLTVRFDVIQIVSTSL